MRIQIKTCKSQKLSREKLKLHNTVYLYGATDMWSMQSRAEINCEASLWSSFIRLSHHASLLFFLFLLNIVKEPIIMKTWVVASVPRRSWLPSNWWVEPWWQWTMVPHSKYEKIIKKFEFKMMQASLCFFFTSIFCQKMWTSGLTKIIYLPSFFNHCMKL